MWCALLVCVSVVCVVCVVGVCECSRGCLRGGGVGV